MARDFKLKGEKDREDLFSATPPLEAHQVCDFTPSEDAH